MQNVLSSVSHYDRIIALDFVFRCLSVMLFKATSELFMYVMWAVNTLLVTILFECQKGVCEILLINYILEFTYITNYVTWVLALVGGRALPGQVTTATKKKQSDDILNFFLILHPLYYPNEHYTECLTQVRFAILRTKRFPYLFQ